MTRATRWALAVGALALALLVALLPRTDGSYNDSTTPPGSTGAAELAEARQRADLPACPGTAPEDTRARGRIPQLAGVRVRCLGDGSRTDLGTALAGEVTLINVWATWCEPCREELPLLADYAAEPTAARVLLVQVQSTPVDGLNMLAELGVRLPSVHDGEGVRGPVREALRVPSALPASYVVGADGEVDFVTEPRLFGSVADVRAAVERAR